MNAAPNTDTVIDRLRQFLLSELVDAEDVADVAADDNLIGDGIIDSMGAVRLATYLEDEYAIEVGPEDFIVENFRSLSTLAALVLQRRADTA